MDFQLIVVVLIGIVAVSFVLRAVYRFFFVKKKSDRCGGCTGCSIGREKRM